MGVDSFFLEDKRKRACSFDLRETEAPLQIGMESSAFPFPRPGISGCRSLPYSKNKALVETTWLSKMVDNSQKDYDKQIKNYIEENLNLKNYKITYKEEGAIPLFYPLNKKERNKINIGTAGGMTRLSTGYTFLNIQEHSKYIRENFENITNINKFEIAKKYQFLDEIFLRVLEKHPEKMSEIFFKMFEASPNTVIKFLSNKSNFFDDLSIILKMPKLIFIKALFK